MPQRFLRPGIRTSGSWNSASFQAQSLYIAIMTLVDDWGRYDGRPALLHGECFALRTNVKRNQTAALLKELHRVGLIQLYEINGKEYLQVKKWQERARGSKSRFPDPPQESAAECSEAQEKDASLALATTPSPSFLVPDAASAALRTGFEKWMKFRRDNGKRPKDWDSLFREQYEWLQKFPESDRIEILSQSIRNCWQGLFELKGGRNGTHQGHTAKGSSRTYGTANERRIGQYDKVGKLPVPNS